MRRSCGQVASSVSISHVERQTLSVNGLCANHKLAMSCLTVLELAVFKVHFWSISKRSCLPLQEESVLNFNIPCEVLLTILVTSEGKDKENKCASVWKQGDGFGVRILEAQERVRREGWVTVHRW
jgi:hypothetical protein